MKQQGNWLCKTSEEHYRKWFEDLYEITVPDLIKDYELQRFEVKQKAFVFLEYNGDVNGIIRLNEGDKAVIYGDGRWGLPVNTDGIAVLEITEADGTFHQWVITDSPYELEDDEDPEWDDLGKDPLGLIEYEPMLWFLKLKEVMFIRQL